MLPISDREAEKCEFGFVLAALAAAVWLIFAGVAQAEPLRIFYFTWVGYGPLFVAQEKGFFGQRRCRGRADQTR